MKYVKLFESWLNEEEEGNITTFNRNAPRDWPVMKTEISNVYPNGRIDLETFMTVLGRANQSGKTFNKRAKIEYHSFETISVDNDGNIDLRDKTVNTDSDTYNETMKIFKDAGIKNVKGFSVFGIGIGEPNKGEKYQPYAYSDADNGCMIFLAEDLKKAGVSPSSGPIVDLPLVVVYNRKIYGISLGQLLCFINQGISTLSVSALTENPSSALQTIFAGEGKAKLLAYEKTIGEKRFYAAPRTDEDPSDSKMKARDGVYTIGPDGTEYIGQILFEFDKADLTQEAKGILSKSANLKSALIDAKKVEIIGHADGKGEAGYNDKLSAARAKSVEEYLMTLPWWKKVDATITVKGMGFKQKVAEDNKGTNALAAALNRRVEFIIDNAKPDYTEIKNALGLK